MARRAYLATIAARARGAAPALVPPAIPMRGWDGAWPAELPPAAVVKPATPDGATRPANASAALPAWSPPRAPDPAIAVDDAAAPRRVPPIAPDADAPRSIVRDPAVAQLEPPGRRSQAGVVEPPLVEPPRDDRAAHARVEHAAFPAVRTVLHDAGMIAPLRPVPPARADEPTRTVAAADPASPPPSARLSQAAALHAALHWVSSPATERPASSAAPAAPPSAPRPIAPPPPASRSDARPSIAAAPDRSAAPRTLHIGSIDVEIHPAPRDAPPGDAPPAPPAPARPAGPLARGFTTPLGLRQG